MSGEHGTLPFLVIHGTWFWIVPLVASAVILTVLLVLIRHALVVASRRATLKWVFKRRGTAVKE